MNESPTIVIFRKWKPPAHGIIALMPGVAVDDDGLHCGSYEAVGGHAGANYHHVIRTTWPASEAEYKDLFDLMTKLDYNLVVRHRASAKLHRERKSTHAV